MLSQPRCILLFGVWPASLRQLLLYVQVAALFASVSRWCAGLAAYLHLPDSSHRLFHTLTTDITMAVQVLRVQTLTLKKMRALQELAR